MRIKYPIATGVVAVFVLGFLALLTFAAGGIVGRHHVTPLVAIVDTAEENVRAVVNSLGRASGPQEYFTSAYYQLKMTTRETSETGEGDNAALAPLDEGYLIARRAGALLFAQIEDGGAVSVSHLSQQIPTNKQEFLDTATNDDQDLKIHFGVKDLFAHPQTNGVHLYATHHYWYPDQSCAVLRLSVLETTAEGLLNDQTSASDWRTVMETQPCLPLDNKRDHNDSDNMFMHSGGRIELLNDRQLLVSVGDHFRDAVHNDNLVQDPDASYGKMLLVNIADGSTSVYSLGHRNPQGVYVDTEGNIWATEHGPRGGDELNLIKEGNNYGWPQVSYGTDYVGVTWPEHLDWAGHDGYDQPVFAWVPSIASNNIIRLEDSAFSLWEGNLIVASLRDRAIHRLTIEDRRVIANERINIGSRVRDLMETEDGQLLLLTDDGKLVTLEAVNQEAMGEEVPQEAKASRLWVSCDSCHSLDPADGHSVGPNLQGIVGSDIAGFEDYDYTEALANLDGQWTPERLDQFLQDPQEFAPGTAMMFPGFEDAEERRIIIEYLQSQ